MPKPRERSARRVGGGRAGFSGHRGQVTKRGEAGPPVFLRQYIRLCGAPGARCNPHATGVRLGRTRPRGQCERQGGGRRRAGAARRIPRRRSGAATLRRGGASSSGIPTAQICAGFGTQGTALGALTTGAADIRGDTRQGLGQGGFGMLRSGGCSRGKARSGAADSPAGKLCTKGKRGKSTAESREQRAEGGGRRATGNRWRAAASRR